MPEFHAGFHSDDLTLAFLAELAHRIVAADDDVDETEEFIVGKLCPAERLLAAGFIDETGRRTDRYQEALRAALRVLPSMPLDEKRILIDDLLAVGLVDGDLHPRESQVVFHGARMLGLSDEDLDEILDSHPAIGPVDPGDPET